MPGPIDPDLPEELYARIADLEHEVAHLESSRTWRLAQRLHALADLVAPAGSRRRIGLGGVEHRIRAAIRKKGQWRSTGAPVFWLISHEGGGGTGRHVRELAAGLRSEGVRTVMIRPSGSGPILWEEHDQQSQVVWSRQTAPDRGSFAAMYRLQSPVHAHVHHVIDLPGELPVWLASLGLSYDWTIHDYFPICPRAHLNRASGTYCGEPDEDGCNACLDRLGDYRGNPVAESITSWRERFMGYLSGARRVFVPSEDVKRRLARYFPELDMVVRPHFDTLPDSRCLTDRSSQSETVRIAVLGTITRVKGSERLLACARDAERRRLPLEFRVIGTMDCDAALTRLSNVHISGPYREAEVAERIAAERCHVAFLPSVWPETFMYTLSIVMEAGFYVICFDLGAQAERLKSWGWGEVLPVGADSHEINNALLRAARSIVPHSNPPAPPRPAEYPNLLQLYFGFTDRDLGMRINTFSRRRNRRALTSKA